MKLLFDKISSGKWGLPIFLIGVTLVWCYVETFVLMDPRCHAVGFHPCVIFALPFALLVSLALVVFACYKKSVIVGLVSITPILLLGLPIYNAYELGIYGWSNEVRVRTGVNEIAIRNADLSAAHFDEVPYKDHKRMVQVVGFQWVDASEMTGAKNGVFYGFVVDSVPHVYICPLMNGARGVAWVTDSSKIDRDPNVKYEFTGVANWYVWTLSV